LAAVAVAVDLLLRQVKVAAVAVAVLAQVALGHLGAVAEEAAAPVVRLPQ
jgi:hypothetical protein